MGSGVVVSHAGVSHQLGIPECMLFACRVWSWATLKACLAPMALLALLLLLLLLLALLLLLLLLLLLVTRLQR